jgi:hypothetical protein
MAIELITGVGADNHISSNDFRAFNRANFGQGRYILKDADNMAIDVSGSTGTITIHEGSCLWSGMHIRLPSAEQLNYVVPTASQMIYVYLHYVKEATSGVESVSFVISAGKTMKPEIDSLADNTVEAYTLFCSFIATSSNISNLNCYFVTAKNFAEMKRLIKNAHSETVLFDGEASIGATINLAENFRNFYEIEIQAGELKHRTLTSNITDGQYDFNLFGAFKIADSVDMAFQVQPTRFGVSGETKFVYTNSLNIWFANAIYGEDKAPITKIIGIGRKS